MKKAFAISQPIIPELLFDKYLIGSIYSIVGPAVITIFFPLNSFDLFFYNLDTDNKELVRITNTPFANEHTPVAVDETHFAFLSDESGIYNRYVAKIDTVFAYNEKVILLKDGDELTMHPDSSLNIDCLLYTSDAADE